MRILESSPYMIADLVVRISNDLNRVHCNCLSRFAWGNAYTVKRSSCVPRIPGLFGETIAKQFTQLCHVNSHLGNYSVYSLQNTLHITKHSSCLLTYHA